MRSKWIWPGVISAVVLAAFLFPRLLLWHEQKSALKSVLRQGAGTLLNFDELMLSEKQSLLAGGKLNFVPENEASTEDILPKFLQELEKLHACGAWNEDVHALLQEIFSDGIVLKLRHVIDASGGGSFLVCELMREQSCAYYDMETGKILCLSLNGAWTQEFMNFVREEPKSLTLAETLQAQLRSWAEYYGMSAAEFVTCELPNSLRACCTMRDTTGGSFLYAASWNFEEENFFFSAIPFDTNLIQESE